jgi:putative transposase
MTAIDVADTLTIALRSSCLERVRVRHRPRLLSDNGPSYLSAELGSWFAGHGRTHTRGRPYHPMTRQDRALPQLTQKPDPVRELLLYRGSWRRVWPSLSRTTITATTTKAWASNLTPADLYFGRAATILARRQTIKHKTIELRRQLHHRAQA